MNCSAHLLPVLPLTALLLTSDGARLRHAPADGQVLAIDVELEFEATCETSDFTVDGQPIPPGEMPPGFGADDLTLELALSAEFSERAFTYLEGNLMGFIREVGAIRIGGLPLPMPSPLDSGSRIRFSREAPDDSFERLLIEEDDDEGVEQEALALVHENLLYSELAPEDEVEVDDGWSAEVDAGLFVRMLLPSFDLEGLGGLVDGLGLDGFAGDLVMALPAAMDDGLQNTDLDLRVIDVSEGEGGTLVRIAVSGTIEMDLDLTRAIQTLADVSTDDKEVTIDAAHIITEFEVEGELTWLAGDVSHLTAYQLDMEGPAELEIVGVVSDIGTEMDLAVLLGWDVLHSVTLDAGE